MSLPLPAYVLSAHTGSGGPPRTLWPDPHIELVFGRVPVERPPGIQWAPLRLTPGAGPTLRLRLAPWAPPGLGVAPSEIEALLAAGDARAALEAASHWLWRQDARQRPTPAPLAAALRRMLAPGPPPSLGELEDLGQVSGRTLERQARARLGGPLRAYARLIRFDRAVGALWSAPGRPLAQLAYDLGYADQAHLTREVRAFAGHPPRALLSELFKTPHTPAVTLGP